ncbi:HAD family hydrolase [Lysinibacillus sp. NPDC098008]|uniref:HAD family hydrolase n=1 Tax=Lysinibacillus sp. NPDC098008 TaxID=3364146 RepID=UPI0038101F51
MIKGILFDKDGTLIEFNSLWINLTKKIVHDIIKQYNIDEKNTIPMLEVLGIQANDTLVSNSLIASETLYDSAQALAPFINESTETLYKLLDEMYYVGTCQHPDAIKPIGDVKKLFQELHNKNIRVGIVTADQYNVTAFTLQHLGLMPYVDFIATADTYPKKPSPEALHAFCNKFNLQQSDVIHIGDTKVDMLFGQNTKQPVGVLSGTSDLATLQQYSTTVLPTIHDIVHHFRL